MLVNGNAYSLNACLSFANQRQESYSDKGEFPVVAYGHEEANKYGAKTLQDEADAQPRGALDLGSIAT